MADQKSVIEKLNNLHAVACGLDGTQCYINGIGIRQLRELIRDATTLLAQPVTISRWVKLTGDFTTPGGTPYFVSYLGHLSCFIPANITKPWSKRNRIFKYYC